MTEFRFPPFKLPESAEVEARPSGAREAGGSEFRFAPVELAEPARREARPPAAQDPVAAEFRFPPLRLSEPTGSNGTPAPARTGSSCCANCDQGLPCASKAGGCSAAHAPHEAGCRAAAPVGGQCAQTLPPPTSPPPLTSEPPPAEGQSRPFWKPMDVEVKLKPMLGCIPPYERPTAPGEAPGPDDWGLGKLCDPDWEPDQEPDTNPPSSGKTCRPLPQDPDLVFENFEDESKKCALTACNAAIESCAPIFAGLYSPRSRAQPVFSYSRWKGGYLETLPNPGGPPHGLADCSLIRAIARYIDMTRKGDEVLIAIAAWSDVAWVIGRSVLDARTRGVTIRVISGNDVGGWANTGSWISAKLALSLGPSGFKLWNGGYKPFGSQISHNKFVLIKRKTSPSPNAPLQHLVLISGANWARFDIARHCDLLTLDSEIIWGAFRQFFEALWSASPNTIISYPSTAEDSNTGVTAHFWPILDAFGQIEPNGSTPAKNPFYRIINKYDPGKGTKIRIIAANWWRVNKNNIATGPGSDLLKLLRIHRIAGSDVRVIGNHHRDTDCHGIKTACNVDPGDKNSEEVAPCETRNEVWEFLNDNKIPWAKCPPHAKVLLVSGRTFPNGQWRQEVYTGSMNISYETNMPDAFVGVHDDPIIFSQYENWWTWMCSNAAMGRGGTSNPADLVCGDMLNNK